MIENGFLCRNEIIWYKPNQMPTSVKNRYTIDYEKLYFFTINDNYYFKQQFEKYTKPLNRWGGSKIKEQKSESIWDIETKQNTYRTNRNLRPNENGKNKRCVWEICTKPDRNIHVQKYPEQLIESPIDQTCPINGIVLDPFVGSGTTQIVQKKQNKNFIGIDINQEYCNLQKQNIKKTTFFDVV